MVMALDIVAVIKGKTIAVVLHAHPIIIRLDIHLSYLFCASLTTDNYLSKQNNEVFWGQNRSKSPKRAAISKYVSNIIHLPTNNDLSIMGHVTISYGTVSHKRIRIHPAQLTSDFIQHLFGCFCYKSCGSVTPLVF